MHGFGKGSRAAQRASGLSGLRWPSAKGDHAEGATFSCAGPYCGFHKACVKDGHLIPQDSLAEEWAGIHRSSPHSLFAIAETARRIIRPEAYTWGSMPLRYAARMARERGGHPPQRLAIPKPPRPVMGFIGAVEEMSPGLMELVEAKGRELDDSVGHFPDRHRWLPRMVDTKIRFEEEEAGVYAMAWTRVLEIWDESVIRNMPQAVSYALSMHPEWREVGLAWLEGHRLTWVRDYQLNHLEAVSAARRHANFGIALPQWLTRSRLGLVPLYPPLPAGGDRFQNRAAYEASYVHHRNVCEPGTGTAKRPNPRMVTLRPDNRVTCGLDIMLEAACIDDLEDRTLCSAELLEAADEVSGDPERPRVTMAVSTSKRILEAHGGFWVADCNLPKRARTVRDALPGKLRDPAQMEWVLHDSEVFAIAHEPDHLNRHDALLEYVGGQSYADDDAEGALKRALAITLVLDAWAEGHAEGLPAAVAYAHCLVPRWRRAALKWLKPNRGVYLPQYFRDRPELAVLTREVRKVVTDLPQWLNQPLEGVQRRADLAWKRQLS